MDRADEVEPLRLDGVSHHFGSRAVLDDVSLVVGHGTTGLLGVNGAGKSTLLRIAAGALRPTSGRVRVHGDDLHARSTRRRAARRIAWVPQDLAPPSRFTVREALTYLAWLRGVPRAERADAVRRAAAAVSVDDLLGRRIGQLSGGQVRRVTIAQALLADPSVLLLDEPTTGLDPHQRSQLRELVGRVARDRAVLLASHIVEDVAYLAERVVVLDRGGVRYDGVPGALAHRGRQAGDGPGSDLERGFLDLLADEVSA